MNNFEEVDGILVDQRMRYNKRERPIKKYVDDGPLEIITEQGYMDTKTTIQRFMQAGIVLQNYKRGLYDEGLSDE